ncbi:MAG: hypothetical protein A2Y98_01985 [Candidatus Portnoybacteria bacterium RBG_19FT_COMBO_36_7]|uniref:Uncharacterized protein n=1 Tax=Candidatus Portnoybacteria bacterium RBG_19FT_COMBO_36_7 TaxID=1801992 RepID=A0A1G2F9F7_9BACT|nr:MAG: hypothetical protein A2Y98_01985 [Candidatus Portnoybacteria bacterium RBG_19FT_COMBO_36_7]
MEPVNFEKIKNVRENENYKKPLSEQEIKDDIRETLKLSPFFEKELTPEEQDKLIEETYEKHYKEKLDKAA